MEEQCAYFKFIVAHPSVEVAVSVAKALRSYTARVLILQVSKLVLPSFARLLYVTLL